MRNLELRQIQLMESYIVIKYGGAYRGAIRRQYDWKKPEAWNDRGELKPEYQLTDKEEEALKYNLIF